MDNIRVRIIDWNRKVEQFTRGSLAITPLNRSSGGKECLRRISKMENQYIRRLLVVGMMTHMRQILKTPERYNPWFADIVARKPGKVTADATANKTARMIWAVVTRNEPYRIRTI